MRAVCSQFCQFLSRCTYCATYAEIQRYKIHNILFNSFMHSIRFNGQSQTMNLIEVNIIFLSLSTQAAGNIRTLWTASLGSGLVPQWKRKFLSYRKRISILHSSRLRSFRLHVHPFPNLDPSSHQIYMRRDCNHVDEYVEKRHRGREKHPEQWSSDKQSKSPRANENIPIAALTCRYQNL